jgi:hypothetical protein
MKFLIALTIDANTLSCPLIATTEQVVPDLAVRMLRRREQDALGVDSA